MNGSLIQPRRLGDFDFDGDGALDLLAAPEFKSEGPEFGAFC